MAFNDTLGLTDGLTDILFSNETLAQALPPEIISSIGTVLLILKTAGIIFMAYIVFLIVMSVLNITKTRRIKKIYVMVGQIDKKLDRVLHSRGQGSKKEESKEKKKDKKT